MSGKDKYASERFKPKSPACAKSHINLLFNGKKLIMTSGIKKKRVYRYMADSGKPNEMGRFSYSKERQKTPYKGPIPEGEYWINPDEFWENAWYKIGSESAWGKYRITIHPFPKTNTYNRGGFFIHGGDLPGSAGCIDLTTQMSQFYKDLKREINTNTNCYIILKVDYNG